MIFTDLIALKNDKKRGLFSRWNSGLTWYRGGATRAHADACMSGTCGARQTRGGATRAHADAWVAPTWHEGLSGWQVMGPQVSGPGNSIGAVTQMR